MARSPSRRLLRPGWPTAEQRATSRDRGAGAAGTPCHRVPPPPGSDRRRTPGLARAHLPPSGASAAGREHPGTRQRRRRVHPDAGDDDAWAQSAGGGDGDRCGRGDPGRGGGCVGCAPRGACRTAVPLCGGAERAGPRQRRLSARAYLRAAGGWRTGDLHRIQSVESDVGGAARGQPCSAPALCAGPAEPHAALRIAVRDRLHPRLRALHRLCLSPAGADAGHGVGGQQCLRAAGEHAAGAEPGRPHRAARAASAAQRAARGGVAVRPRDAARRGIVRGAVPQRGDEHPGAGRWAARPLWRLRA